MQVLIIDDHKLIRKGIKEFLESAAEIKVVGESENFDQALDALKNFQPDITILDIRLGEQNGLDLLLEKTEICPNTKFLVCSMYKTPSLVKTAFERGASGFLTKAAPESELLKAITKIAGGGIYQEINLTNSIKKLKSTFELLTEREQDVFVKIQMHETNLQIADELGVNQKTIENYIYRICDKTGLKNRNSIEEME